MRSVVRVVGLTVCLATTGCGSGSMAPTLTMVGTAAPCIDPHTGATRGTYTLWCDGSYSTCEFRFDGAVVATCTGGSSSQSCIDAATTAANACLGTGPSTDGGPGHDGGAPTTDGGPTCHPPTTTYGTIVGTTFRPVTLDDCGGVSHDFYAADHCSFRYTVVTFTAGWSVPGRAMLDQMAAWRSSYPDVRFIDVFVQDASYAAPTMTTCAAWQSAHTTPFELMDPEQHTNVYFPDGALPAAAIVDATGIIRYRGEGGTTTAAALRSALDGLP